MTTRHVTFRLRTTNNRGTVIMTNNFSLSSALGRRFSRVPVSPSPTLPVFKLQVCLSDFLFVSVNLCFSVRFPCPPLLPFIFLYDYFCGSRAPSWLKKFAYESR